MLKRPRHNDAGFTLVELVVTLTIIAIILVPLTQVVITYMLNSETIRARQFESKDQQLAAQYWAADVDSLGRRDTSGSTPSFAAQSGINTGTCTPSPALVGATPQISFQWTTSTFTGSAGSAPTISYGTSTVTYWTQGTKLVRTSCSPSGSEITETVANTLLVDASHAVGCNSDGSSTYVACPSLSGDGHTGVYLHFYVADPSKRGQGYWATLVGQRRQTP